MVVERRDLNPCDLVTDQVGGLGVAEGKEESKNSLRQLGSR